MSLGSQQQNLSIAHNLQVGELNTLEERLVNNAVFLQRLVFPHKVSLATIYQGTCLDSNTKSLQLVVGHHGLVETVAVGTLPSHESIVERLAWVHESVGTLSNHSSSLTTVVHLVGTPALHQQVHIKLVPHLL